MSQPRESAWSGVLVAAIGLVAGCDRTGVNPDVGVDGASSDAEIASDAGVSRRAMFVAVGAKARTTISCDDGLTWVANHSDDDTIRCGGGVDCDHDDKVGHGIAFGASWFVANFGHGPAGQIRRSADGVTWTRVDAAKSYQSMMRGATKFVAAGPTPLISTDDGATWTPGTRPVILVDGVRQAVTYRGGVYDGTGFLMVADWPVATYSTDGTTWTQRPIPAGCDALGSLVAGAGTLMLLGSAGLVCRSTDAGATWQTSTVVDQPRTLVWTGTTFLILGKLTAYRSPDGVAWTSEALKRRALGVEQATPPQFGAVGVSPTGSLVAATPALVSYEKQRFYRSADGATWDELPLSAFTGSHPIKQFAWGMGLTSTACPP